MLAYFREDRIPILSKILRVPDHPWQSRNSVPPDLSLRSWLSRNRRITNSAGSQEIWFYCIHINSILLMFGRTEFRFCQIVRVPDHPWQSRNSVPPDISLQSWLSRNRRVSNMRESQEIWFFCTNCMLMMFGRTEFRFCQKYWEFPIIPDRVGTLFPRIFLDWVDWVEQESI